MFVCVVYYKKMVDTEEGSLEYKLIGPKSSAIAFSFAWVFNFFSDHFLLFVLASVVSNHNTATETDVLNEIAGTLKCTPDKIGAGGRRKTGDNDETEYFNTCEYGPKTFFNERRVTCVLHFG